MIKFLELESQTQEIDSEISEAILRVSRSGQYILGPEVEKFENSWAQYCQSSYCVGVSNGLDALKLALAACGIGPGDEVLVPSNTFIATWLAVTHLGAQVVPVEPTLLDYNIDPSRVVEKITSKTKAIIGVHLFGHPFDLHALNKIAKEHNLFLIEDAAQAHGAEFNSKILGAGSDVTCWSFYPGKNLGAFGDAGAVTTNNPEIVNRIKMLRNYGSKEKYRNELLGFNARLDPMQAAVLNVKLNHLNRWNTRRKSVAGEFLQKINNNLIFLPNVAKNVSHAWHLFVIRTSKRDKLVRFLEHKKIQTIVHYPIPPHRQPIYADLKFELPIADMLADTSLSIPNRPNLTNEEINYICETLNEWSDLNE